MRKISISFNVHLERPDPMPARSFLPIEPIWMAVESDGTCSFELDLAGGWRLEFTLTSDGIISGTITYRYLPVPYSSVYVNDKIARTDLEGKFETKVSNTEELHIRVVVPTQVSDALHEFFKKEHEFFEKKREQIEAEMGGIRGFFERYMEVIRRLKRVERDLVSTRVERWKEEAKKIKLELESDPFVPLLKLWLASILEMVRRTKKETDKEHEK